MILIFITILCILIPGPAYCEDNTDSKTNQDTIDEWRETLNYGIDTQIVEVITKIKDLGETELNKELLNVLRSSISVAVRTSILDFFQATEYKEAESTALIILKNYENEKQSLIVAVINYLCRIKAITAVETMVELLDYDDKVVAIQAIEAIGQIGDQTKADILLEKLEDDEYEEERKAQIILALGDLKARDAVPALIDIVEDRDSDRIWRMWACDSLGKIKDTRAIDTLKNVFAENDSLLKAYAASALANFNLNDVIDILIQGLKDSNWKVRVAAAKGLARKEAAQAVDILIFKAKKDPEMVVKQEAINSLGKIGDTMAIKYLQELFNDDTANQKLREAALKTLMNNELSDSTVNIIENVVKREWDKKDTKVMDIISRNLAYAESPNLKGLFALLLDCPYFIMRMTGIKGIVRNKFYDLKERIKDLAENDPVAAVKNMAQTSLKQL